MHLHLSRARTPLAPLAPLALLAALVLPAAVAGAFDPPRDARGLPLWEVREWTDFPVRMEFGSADALTALLAGTPIADFDRSGVRPAPGGGLTVETRVTEAEAAALEAAGVRFERVPDLEREGRRAIEAEWRHQAEQGEASLRSGPDKGVYHTHAQIGTILAAAETNYPALCDRISLGTSVQGRDLWTIRISDNVSVEEAEPEVRLAGTIHGNEPPAQEMLLYLVDWLTSQYGVDPDVTALVDATEIHITPCLNPDGLTAGTRRNAHNVDLNRNFPTPNGTIGDDGTWTQEPETVAIRTYGENRNFVISENGHTGAMVVNYPWDYTYTRAPDDAALILLSLEYSTYNLPMYNGDWPQGITNGADWYVVSGGLQDWSYHYTGGIDVTIELSDSFAPPASQLDALWNNNRESFLHFIRAARYGLHGRVTDSVTGLPLAATISVAGNPKPVVTDPDHGDWYKLLPTGTYTIVVTAEGHLDRTLSGLATVWGTPTFVDVTLDPVGTDATAAGDAPDLRLAASPNPFRGGATLRFAVPRPGRVRLAVHDAAGRLVRSLLDAPHAAGPVALRWDGTSDAAARVADGVYFVRLEADGLRQSAKLVRVR